MSKKKSKWYQVYVVMKDGSCAFLYRFLSTSDKKAKKESAYILSVVINSNQSIKNVHDNYVRQYEVSEVPKCILKRYDLTEEAEVELFKKAERG